MVVAASGSRAYDPSGNPCDHFNPSEAKGQSLEKQLTQIDRDELMQESDDLLQELAEFRGLKVKYKVEKSFKDKEFFRGYFKKILEKANPPDTRKGFEEAMVWLGMLPPKSDWMTQSSETMADRILGLYDPETKMFYLADWRSSQQMRETMIHEMVHALQDQNFGLEQLQKDALRWNLEGNQDRAMALQALWEGEAVALTWQFRKSTGDDPELKLENSFEKSMQLNREMENGRRRAWGCPLRMTEYLNFPYVQGALFVDRIYETKGWKGVDRLWEHPPITSREILSGGEDSSAIEEIHFPQMNPGVMEGGQRVWSQTMGAYGLLEFLFNYLGEKTARAAVEGWRGDHFEFWRGNEGDWKALLARVTFANPQEAQAFANAFAYSQWRRFPILSILERDENIQWLKTSNHDACVYVECSDNDVLVVEGLEASKTSAAREVLLREKPVLTHGDRILTVPW